MKCRAVAGQERIVLDYKAPARLLSLDGRLFRCTIGRSGNPASHSIWIEAVEQPIGGGMSDSPLVAESGSAVGLIWHVEQPDAARPKSTPSRQPAGMATSPTRRLSGRRARARPAAPSRGRGSFLRGRKPPS